MSRRGRSGPTISLFSFQDIITSVTAIVTVITLLLALDLVQRKQAQSSDSSATLATEVAHRLQQAEAELAQLRSVTNSADDLVREVASTSPAELRTEIAQREGVIAQLEHERAKLEQQSRTWQTRRKEELSEQFDLEPLRNEQVKSDRAATAIEQQISEERAENRTIFTLPRGMQKEGWIAVIDSQRISVAPLGRATRPVPFTASKLSLLGASAADNFGKWIDEQRLSSAYFLLLIRPNAASSFDDVQQMMDRKSISYGFDLVSSDQAILHPEKGAAP